MNSPMPEKDITSPAIQRKTLFGGGVRVQDIFRVGMFTIFEKNASLKVYENLQSLS